MTIIVGTWELGDDVAIDLEFRDGVDIETPDEWFLRVKPPASDAITIPSTDPSITGSAGRFRWTMSTDYEQPAQASNTVPWKVTAVSTVGGTKKTESFLFLVRVPAVPAEAP